MEIYRAVCEFRSPQDDSSDNNILSFSKGDRFEVLDSNKKNIEWWGARALKDNSVGYVPSKYLKYEERKVGKLTSETNDNKILREKSIKRLNDIRQSLEYKPPEDVCPALPEPDPDYLLEEEDDIDSVKVRPGQQNVTLIQVGLSRNHSGGMADYHDNRLTSELQQRLRNSSDSEQNGMILPKKLKNPCLESKERMDLHHELLLNKKTGKNVLKKSELEKKLKEREELRRKKEWEAYKNNKRTSLDLALEQRANALKEKEESSQSKPETTNNSEFSKVHAKITARACEN